MTYVDVWSIVALQERQVRSIEKLWKLNLIERSPKLTLLMAYYRVSNSVLKSLLKMKVRLHAFLVRLETRYPSRLNALRALCSF